MTDPRFDRLMNLVEAAAELSKDDAEQMLVEACADNPELLAEARSLVAIAHAETDASFTQALAGGLEAAASQIVSDNAKPAMPGKIGPYEIQSKLGEGGMGTVYLAHQEYPIRRDVALKIIRSGFADDRTLARFDAERQALARLEHPGIARVYDASTTKDEVPYLAMELVRGEPVTAYCDSRALTITARLELFGQVCRAIQHAHYNGIIHRDIKPSNVLITEVDGNPIVKVIDFGIAKIASDLAGDASNRTQIGTLMGTLEYMSPEQAEGAEQIDTRSDVYSLGVLLYELTSGALPFSAQTFRDRSFTQIRELLLNTDPPPPSEQLRTHPDPESIAARRGSDLRTLLRELQGDLDWIVQRALERDPDHRYATPADLAAETERYQKNEPVNASAPTLTRRMTKFYRRNKLATTAGLLVFIAVTSGAILSTIGFLRAAEAQRIAEHEAMVATETSRFLTQALAIVEPGELEGRETTVREILDLAQHRLDQAQASTPEVEARLRYVLGASYASLGQYPQALANLLRAGELREEYQAATAEQAAQALAALSDILTSRDQFVAALIVNEELASLYAAEYGENSKEHALVQVRIGLLFSQMGARGQARDRLNTAQAIEKVLPDPNPELTSAILGLIQAIGA